MTVSFTVMLSPDAKKCLDRLDRKRTRNIMKHLKELEEEPFRPRTGCDIDIVEGRDRPPLYRLRIGNLRAMYFVDEQAHMVYVTDLFMKTRDSAYREN
jgi:mRNA-degrading endonuclease RelE of RelBE toxin-antitoxin system